MLLCRLLINGPCVLLCGLFAAVDAETKCWEPGRRSPLIMGLSAAAGETLKGQCLRSAWMAGSANLRPINRLASKTVLAGLLAICIQARSSELSRQLGCKNCHKVARIRLATAIYLVLGGVSNQTLCVCEAHV